MRTGGYNEANKALFAN